MSMVEERDVELEFDNSQVKKTPDNSTVKYEFSIFNIGNIQDTYKITASAGSPDTNKDTNYKCEASTANAVLAKHTGFHPALRDT